MSYEATMQFLRTGESDLPGTEDPRYAGGFSLRPPFAGACGGPRPCGAPPIAGQTQRHGSTKGWRLTPDAHRDYSSTVRVPGAPPIAGAEGAWRLTPGAYHDYDSTERVWGAPPIAGAPWHCAEHCANKYSATWLFPEYQACLDSCYIAWPPRPSGTSRPALAVAKKKAVRRLKKKAVLRPLWAAQHQARFVGVAGKSRSDAIRLGKARRGSVSRFRRGASRFVSRPTARMKCTKDSQCDPARFCDAGGYCQIRPLR